MKKSKIESVVIVGGGTAGWMTALALASVFDGEQISVTLVESDQIASVGVGEATIPEIAAYNDLVGIDENEFLSFTNGTFKLGIEFNDWGKKGDSYMHPFGTAGFQLDNIDFYHHWQRQYLNKGGADINDYSICYQAAKAKKFGKPSDNPNSPLANLSYAYHFDATKYAQFLRGYAEQRGVKRIEGKVTKVNLREQDGFINSITLEGNQQLVGDLFIDCSGFKALLIEGALKTGFDDWSHLLPCNNAVTIATKNTEEPIPYTQATAHSAGWQWRIPLQNRVGNGHVYCDKYMSKEQATTILLDNISGATMGEVKHIEFTTGMRKKFWHKNCVAIGLSCGFIEPLESTSIHLIQASIFTLLNLFPVDGIKRVEVDKYNQLLTDSFISIRDFIILHYHVNQRDDSDFWRNCRDMEIPESLKRKIKLYESAGRIYREGSELFTVNGWLAVMHGQGLRAKNCHPLANNYPEDKLEQHLSVIKNTIEQAVTLMPSHTDYIKKHGAAK